MKRLVYILIILVVLILASGFFWVYETQFIVGRANVTQYTFSVSNSYIFVTPLRVRANGEEKARVTVFTLNNQGLGVLGRTVKLSANQDLTIDVIQGLSDSQGKAVFDVSSRKPGDYFLDVNADGVNLPQKAQLSFY